MSAKILQKLFAGASTSLDAIECFGVVVGPGSQYGIRFNADGRGLSLVGLTIANLCSRGR